mgnify:CR=1 FL=1
MYRLNRDDPIVTEYYSIASRALLRAELMKTTGGQALLKEGHVRIEIKDEKAEAELSDLKRRSSAKSEVGATKLTFEDQILGHLISSQIR